MSFLRICDVNASSLIVVVLDLRPLEYDSHGAIDVLGLRESEPPALRAIYDGAPDDHDLRCPLPRM